MGQAPRSRFVVLLCLSFVMLYSFPSVKRIWGEGEPGIPRYDCASWSEVWFGFSYLYPATCGPEGHGSGSPLPLARQTAFSTGIPISCPRTSLRGHSGGIPEISFSPVRLTKKKKKKTDKTGEEKKK